MGDHSLPDGNDNPNPNQQLPTLADLPSTWHLTSEAHTQILTTRILPLELPPPPPNPPSHPVALLLLGQTGAGKTLFAPSLLSALSHSHPPTKPSQTSQIAHLISDTYKPHHPFYHPCLHLHPHLASPLTSPHAAAWLYAVCAHAAAQHSPVLLEAACRREGDVPRLVGVFYSAGYRVRVVVLAVPAALSRLGVMVRYYRRLPEAGPGRGMPVRLTPRGVHDASFGGVGEVVGWLESCGYGLNGEGERNGDGGGAVERIVVVRRDGRVGYVNERKGDGKWRDSTGAAEALERERRRGLSDDERRTAERDIEMLRALRDPKVDRELDEIEALMAELRGDEGGPVLEHFDAQDFVSNGTD